MSYDRSVLPAPQLPSLAEAGNEGDAKRSFVSRAGHKLEAALVAFNIDATGRVCADLGANVGGFTDCLLRYGAARVYAVDTAYGILAWNLRKDPRVVVRDRTNALHVRLPEAISTIHRSLVSFSRSALITATRLASGEKTGWLYKSFGPMLPSSLPSRSKSVSWRELACMICAMTLALSSGSLGS